MYHVLYYTVLSFQFKQSYNALMQKSQCDQNASPRNKALITFVHIYWLQGPSQSHSPGWAKVALFVFFIKFSITFFHFFSNFPHNGPRGGGLPKFHFLHFSSNFPSLFSLFLLTFLILASRWMI